MLRLEYMVYHKDYDYFALPGWRYSSISQESLLSIIDDLAEKCGLIKIEHNSYKKATKEQLMLMKLYCHIPLDIVYF